MLGNDFDENEASNRSGLRRLMIPTIVGIIVMGVAALFVWQFLVHQSSVSPITAQTSGATQTVAQTSGQPQPGSDSSPGDPIPLTPAYKQVAKEALAQGFHLTVDQLQQKLQALPAKRGLFGVAQEQGISTDQLHIIIVNAQQKASDQMVSAGAWTQEQASANMQYWRNTYMKFTGGKIESWFQKP